MARPAYGYRHQQSRKHWNTRLELNGPILCRRCGEPVYCDTQATHNRDGHPFQLGHGIAVVNGGDGTDSQPEHTCCNESAGGRLARARAKPPRVSRGWGTN